MTTHNGRGTHLTMWAKPTTSYTSCISHRSGSVSATSTCHKLFKHVHSEPVRSAKFRFAAHEIPNTRDGKHKFLVDLDHDLTKSVYKAFFLGHCYTPRLWELSPVREGMDGGKIYEERSPNSSRVKFLEHCSVVHLPQSIHPQARMSWTTERGQARTHPNSETSPARGSAGSLRTPRNKSTVDSAAALLEGNFTRPADIEPI